MHVPSLEKPVRYEYQMLDILKHILLHLDISNLPLVRICMFGEDNKDLGVIEYEPSELQKLLNEEGEIKIPVPKLGKIPEIECKIDIPVRVPYGQGPEYEKRLKEE